MSIYYHFFCSTFVVLFIQKIQIICAKEKNYMQSSFSWRVGAGRDGFEEHMHQYRKEERAAVFSRTLLLLSELVIIEAYICEFHTNAEWVNRILAFKGSSQKPFHMQNRREFILST